MSYEKTIIKNLNFGSTMILVKQKAGYTSFQFESVSCLYILFLFIKKKYFLIV